MVVRKPYRQTLFWSFFLLSVQHFPLLITFTEFKTSRRIKTNIGNTSVIIGLLIYPLIAFFSLLTYISYLKKNPHINPEKKRNALWDLVKLNLSPTTLFYKHIFWELHKENNLDEVLAKLKDLQRK